MEKTKKTARRVELVCPECGGPGFWLIQVDRREPGVSQDGFEMHCKQCGTALYGEGLSGVIETARQRGREWLALEMRDLLNVR